MKIQRFEKDGKTVWQSASNEEVFSGCIKLEKVVATEDGMIKRAKYMHWMRVMADDEEEASEVLTEQITQRMADLKAKKLVLIREYSVEPFYDGDTMDTKGEGGESLNRYSRVLAVLNTKKELARNERFIDNVIEEESIVKDNVVEKELVL